MQAFCVGFIKFYLALNKRQIVDQESTLDESNSEAEQSESLSVEVIWKRTCESLGEYIAWNGFPPRYGMRGLVRGN